MFRARPGRIESPFGWIEITWSERGIWQIDFVGDLPAGVGSSQDDPNSQRQYEADFGIPGLGPDTPLDLQGTPWQLHIWAALREIPFGGTLTYGELARLLGRPGASRAVGAACGANPIAILVPCHRVIPADGGLGGYRWGAERKRRLLDFERRAVASLSVVPRGTTAPASCG